MSKIVICSDFHISSVNRINDIRDSMEQIYQYCKNNNDVKFLFFLGDAYTKRNPRQKEMRIFENWAQRINELNINQIYIIGNHDKDDETSALGEFKELKVKDVKIVESGNTVKLGTLKIYLGHDLLREAKLGPLNYTVKKDILTVAQLIYRHKDVDIFLLGHVHKFQILNNKPFVMYIGSIERENFGERDEKKYFATLEIETKKLSFHKLEIREMRQIECKSLKEIEIKDSDKKPIIKIVIKGTKEEVNKELNQKDILQSLKNKCYDLTIQTVIESQIRKRETKISDVQGPVENLKDYCKEKNINEKVTLLGIKIIEKQLKR